MHDHVREAGNFDEPRLISARRPGGHVRAVPDHHIAEWIVLRTRHFHDLEDIFVEVGGRGLLQTSERAEKTEVAGPVASRLAKDVGGGVSRVAGLRVGLGQQVAGEKIDHRAFSGAGAADDGDVDRCFALPVKGRPEHVTNQRRGKAQPGGGFLPVGLRMRVGFQPRKVIGQATDFQPDGGGIHRTLRGRRGYCTPKNQD